MASCEKRSVTTEQMESLVDDIERELRKMEKTEIQSREIGEMVMKRLKRLDKVAYVRFASVYHEFEDVTDFAKKIRELKKIEKDSSKIKRNIFVYCFFSFIVFPQQRFALTCLPQSLHLRFSSTKFIGSPQHRFDSTFEPQLFEHSKTAIIITKHKS